MGLLASFFELSQALQNTFDQNRGIMAITKIDPKSALIAVDMQKGILAMAAPTDVERIVAKTTELANTFHELGLPVVWVHALGLPKGRVEFSPAVGKPQPGFAELHEDLPVKKGDLKIWKTTTNAFLSQELNALLEKFGITNVIIAGIALGGGVESTVRAGFDAGYSMTVACDATADPMQGRAEAVMKFTLPMFSELGNTENILRALRSSHA
ncbi:isochorismatase family cysteine hydrolase [Burkholderia territorii]|uniref:isochorismatase family cysteine hydrolase n=1 Tax=Burkholderia territorii TaxID=1503055 RepID=UPI0009BD82E7|nr:isochorismatase family cysteine hydrolase [Burkholderia territorii]